MNGPLLLSLVEFLGYPNLKPLFERLGFEVVTTRQARAAVAQVRKRVPDVLVADFFYQNDFRDRLSNLESLLASVQPHAGTHVLVLYEARDQDPLDRVRARFRMDAVLTQPTDEAEVERILIGWRAQAASP
jgi:DNA-binding NarL/FixJ family response regulator